MRRAWGRGSRGRVAKPAIRATPTIGTLSQNTELQENHSSSSPPTNGPRPMPTPAIADQIPIALPRSSRGKMSMITDSVAGMIIAPPMPIAAAEHDQLRGVLGERGEHAGDPEQHEPGLQGAFAPEAVAERAHREQDAREGEQVRVDDPLQRGARGREVRLQASAARR